MNSIEVDDKLISLFIALMVGTAVTTIVSWKIIEVITKEIEQGKKWAAFLTALTVGGIVAVFAVVGGGLWLGYRYIRPEAPKSEPPSRTPDYQVASVVTPTPTPQNPHGSQRVFRNPIRTGHRQSHPPAAGTVQTADAPVTPQTSQAPAAAAPEQSQPPQGPSTETRPLFAPAQGPGCTTKPAPATPIIPPGEKSPEQDQLV
ncbi:MAG TPA: hypothetical protein VF591_26140 [Pyrinomonadaceae bacterium]|jgi:apolipoprotein N-acyltransferase